MYWPIFSTGERRNETGKQQRERERERVAGARRCEGE